MYLIDIDPILKLATEQYCPCGKVNNEEHGYFTHYDDEIGVTCAVCEKRCDDKQVNWGIRKIINEIMGSKLVLMVKKATYRRGNLHDLVDFTKSHDFKKLIWEIHP